MSIESVIELDPKVPLELPENVVAPLRITLVSASSTGMVIGVGVGVGANTTIRAEVGGG